MSRPTIVQCADATVARARPPRAIGTTEPTPGAVAMAGPLGEGDTFGFDDSTLEPGINRCNLIEAQRVPGSVDTLTDQ